MKHKGRTNQVADAPAYYVSYVLFALVAAWLLFALWRRFGTPVLVLAVFVGVCVGAWQLLNRREGDVVKLEPAHVVQLQRWCDRLGIGTPEIIKYRITDTGERYDLRVTGADEQGKIMTPEKFRGYWRELRAIAGDGCRGVFISPPDKEHGGRCSMTVVWRGEIAKPTQRYPYPVLMGGGHIHMVNDDNELFFALAEASAKGIVQEVPAWAPPNPAEMAGER